MLNRNVTTLVLALPGSQLNGFQHASSENPQGGLQINVNGQYFYSNGFELDGTENHSNILGIAVINPNPDALEEFKVTTGNYDAGGLHLRKRNHVTRPLWHPGERNHHRRGGSSSPGGDGF